MTPTPLSRDDARFALRRLNTMHFNPDGSPALDLDTVEEIASILGLSMKEVMGNHTGVRVEKKGRA